MDPGESLDAAAHREIVEETGWQAGKLEPMMEYNPLAGISSMHYTTFVASEADLLGPLPDTNEVSRVEWVPLADVPKLASDGQIPDGPSLLMLSYYQGMHRAIAHREG